MEPTSPIYFLTAQDYRKLENTLVQLAGVLEHIYETAFQPLDEEDPLPT
jgi:hypothetical protein